MGRLLLIGWCLTIARASPEQLGQLRASVAEVYQRRGLPAPDWDPELAAVAAEIAAHGGPLEGTLALRARLQARGQGDPAPSGLLLEGRTFAELLATLPRSLPPDLEPATCFGAGLSVGKGAGIRMVVLRLRRKAIIAPIPRSIALSRTLFLRGQLLLGLRDPSCYSQSPDGTVARLIPRVEGPRFEIEIEPRVAGRYVIEVMAEGAGGPEIAWIDQVWVGEAPPAALPERAAVSDSASPAEDQILMAINAERGRLGEPALALDPRLSELARSYSRELGELNLLVHRSPRSGDLMTRLRRSGYRFQRGGENLGEGATPLGAHELIAASPAHRRNLIDPNFDRCGIGFARPQQPGAPPVVLTEIFAGGDAP